MATRKLFYGAHSALSVTSLNSLASSATVGWQSDRVDNTSELALDYLVSVKLSMANTAPANDRAAHVYVSSAYNDGSNWFSDDGGTTTLPNGVNGSYTTANPHNLKLLGDLVYTTQNSILQGTFALSQACGNTVPQGFSVIIVNFTGAALVGSGNAVQIRPVTETIA